MGRSRILGGRYELGDLLGEGGNGRVFRAVQRPLGREVAVKVLRADAGPVEIQRFAREISLVQRLEHPNTVRLYDFGTGEDGAPFIVFELLRGPSLEAAIARGPMAPARVAKIAVQILKSLMEAHALGIVHRDVKPANVLLVDYTGATDFVKVLDFGVARTIGSPFGRSKTITMLGQMVGTPAYMAPEQVREAPLSPCTDLYAVGLVMAEAISGQPVYSGSDGAVWVAQASDTPAPLPPAVRASALGAVVEKATRKNPAERYGSAEEMIADIERAMVQVRATTDTTPTAPPVAITERTMVVPPPKPLRTTKHVSIAALCAMSLLTVALMGMQVRRADIAREAKAAPASLVVHVDRVQTLGWRPDKVGDSVDLHGVRSETWILRTPDNLPQAYVYLTTFPSEQMARSFATYTRAGNPTTAVKLQGRQVLRTNANERKVADRVLELVL